MSEVKEMKSEYTKKLLENMCEDLNKLSNTLVSCKLTPKEIRQYVRSEMRTEAKQLREQFKIEFEHIPMTNVIKQEVFILLTKLGILRNVYVPNTKQIEDGYKHEYSSDELTDTDEEQVEEEFVEGDHSSSDVGSGNDGEDEGNDDEDSLNKSITKLNVSEEETSV